ncbi:MAG: hypothetical protein PHF86_02780 [Candidatus Nanoarchaeia archaeon]|jgi:hypothetical protein|nr:hypothetical protein [Candidatus Nanoarchaeia archaeon]
MTEEKTIFKITIDNNNQFITSIDLSGIEHDEEALRFVHSFLDEYKDEVLQRIRSLKTQVKDEFEEF